MMKLILAIFVQFSLGYSLTIQCSFTSLSWYSAGLLYTCYGYSQANPGTAVELSEVSGEHKGTLKNSDVKALNFNGQSIETLPQNLASYFPNLRVISCIKSGLSSITAADLKPFPNLEYLTLPENKLVSISGDLFKFTPKIEGIILSKNKLKSIGNNLIAGLGNLRFADFQNNPCINGFAQTPSAFAALNYELSVKCPYNDDGTSSREEETPDVCEKMQKCSLAADIKNLQNQFAEMSEEFEQMKIELAGLKAAKTEQIGRNAMKLLKINELNMRLNELKTAWR
jgi:hypothetical protein